jgi:hypothetical protein
MKLTARTARRGAAALAVAGAAALLPAVALAAPGAAAGPAAAPPACTAAQLTAWIGVPGDGSAGSVTYQLELSNTSARPCTLLGYPGVSALGPNGGQLGRAAGRDVADPVRLITLNRGGTAHMRLQVADVGNFSASACHPATSATLRVFPPNDRRSLRIPFSLRACRRSGPLYLTVTTTVAGTGIPGFSS